MLFVGIARRRHHPLLLGVSAMPAAIGALAIAMRLCGRRLRRPMPLRHPQSTFRLPHWGQSLLTGSTPAEAGTATRMALNILSTGVMVQLG